VDVDVVCARREETQMQVGAAVPAEGGREVGDAFADAGG